MRCFAGAVAEFFYTIWQSEDAAALGVEPGETGHQTFWEFLTLLLALIVWGPRVRSVSVPVLGDNTGALQSAISLRGRGPLLAVARELAWRQVRGSWKFTVGHLPSEHNVTADALSRVADSGKVAWPAFDLGTAAWAKPPRIADVWRARPAP